MFRMQDFRNGGWRSVAAGDQRTVAPCPRKLSIQKVTTAPVSDPLNLPSEQHQHLDGLPPSPSPSDIQIQQSTGVGACIGLIQGGGQD